VSFANHEKASAPVLALRAGSLLNPKKQTPALRDRSRQADTTAARARGFRPATHGHSI